MDAILFQKRFPIYFSAIKFDNNNILNVKKWVRYACSSTVTSKEELVFKEQELFMPHYGSDSS